MRRATAGCVLPARANAAQEWKPGRRRSRPGPCDCPAAGPPDTRSAAQGEPGTGVERAIHRLRALRSVQVPLLHGVLQCRPPRPGGSSRAAWVGTPRSCPATARRGEITAPGCASNPGGRSGAVPTVLKIECVLAVEPWVRINLLRQDKSGGKLYFFASRTRMTRTISPQVKTAQFTLVQLLV